MTTELLNAQSEQASGMMPLPFANAPLALPAQQTHSVVSMFSGCGGMDLGFLGGFEFLGRYYPPNPFKIVWANDFNPFACATYARNIGDHIRLGDVWKQMDSLPKRADVLIGGFPCQDISINGKGLGVKGKRSGLYRAMVEGILRVKPKVFIAENVKGLLMKHNRASLRAILHDFEALGYRVTYSLYRAADFGVPQNRERVLIVGTSKRVRVFRPPPPPLSSDKWVSASAAIADLERLSEDKTINHIWSVASRSPDQGERVLHPHRPAQTIRAECHGNIQFHYKLPRRISMREAARFQSFPDSFIFHAKLRETERQVGNAVPPLLAWHVARAIAAILS